MHKNPMILAGARLAALACMSNAEPAAASAPEVSIEEYASFTIRLDHLQDDEANDGHVILATINSTREVVDDVVNLMTVHGQSHFLNHKDIRALLAQVEGNKGLVVYVADPSRTYIVIDSALYDLTAAQPAPMGGSRLNTDSSFIALARAMMTETPLTDDGQARKFWAYVAD